MITTLSNKSERKRELRDRHKSWLTSIIAARGQSLTQLAREAGLDQSALTRFMNDDERGGTLDTLTIDAVMALTGADAPFPRHGGRGRALEESESEPYEPTPHEKGMIGQSNQHLAWFVLKSRALEFEGFRPGDRMIVDLNARPEAGDIVCAQFYSWSNPALTQTVFRLYEPPALVTSGPIEQGRRLRLVDGENVIVKGVLRTMLRQMS